MPMTRSAGAVLAGVLVATLAATVPQSAQASGEVSGQSSSPAARAAVSAPAASTARAALTPREKQLSRKKPCTKRQARRTPVRCQRIKAARAKAAALARPARPAVVRPPTVPVVQPGTPSDLAPFTLAVIPDTQQEVFGSDTRMQQRSQWLVQQREELNLKFVDHIGDVTNWGWLARPQLDVASAGMRPLEQAGIPYSLSIGNHDTGAVGWDGKGGYGGGAYVSNPECQRRLGAAQCKTGLLVRRTTEFNAVFTAERYGAVRGAFESGKVDNTYSTFTAGGRDWMVLNLELWPRTAVVDWARRVVEAHPRHNVVVSTHSYLDGDGGGIYGGADYGANSPRYVFDHLVSQYANVKLVLSGHVGTGTVRYDTGRHGNRVVSLLQSFHSNQGNPVRLVRIDPQSGTLRTWVTSPNGRGGDFSQHTRTIEGLDFVD